MKMPGWLCEELMTHTGVAGRKHQSPLRTVLRTAQEVAQGDWRLHAHTVTLTSCEYRVYFSLPLLSIQRRVEEVAKGDWRACYVHRVTVGYQLAHRLTSKRILKPAPDFLRRDNPGSSTGVPAGAAPVPAVTPGTPAAASLKAEGAMGGGCSVAAMLRFTLSFSSPSPNLNPSP